MQFSKQQFIKAGSIVLSGSVLANALNYFFNVIMGRMLSPSSFGEVAALVTLMMIVVVPATTITMTIAHSVAGYVHVHQARHSARLFHHVFELLSIVGLLLALLFWLSAPWLADFFHIPVEPLVIFGLVLPLSLYGALARGTVQGLQWFARLSALGVLESLLKLILSIVFVWLGWDVAGVMGALVCAAFGTFLYALWLLRPIIRYVESIPLSFHRFAQHVQVLRQLPTKVYTLFFASLGLALLSNIDVMLVKHYLPPREAGLYAAVAILGRIMTYGSTAVVTVMFPMLAAGVADARMSRSVLAQSLWWTLLLAGGILSLFVFIPDYLVSVLFGAQYQHISQYLVVFGIFTLCLSLARVLVTYFMARVDRGFLWVLGMAVLIEIGIIATWHATVWEVVYGLVLSGAMLLFGLIGLYLYQQRSRRV